MGILSLIFISLICIILLRGTKYDTKGILGEKKVAGILSSLSHKKYKVINDVLIKSGSMTFQIDHIVVSVYGIFVIETKNYKGLITGFEDSEYWIKNIFKNKYEFYNPIKQNAGHILALSKKLHLTDNKFISIIVFSNEASLKVKTSQKVVYMSELNKSIRRYKKIKFSSNEVDDLVEKIRSHNIKTVATKRQHISNVKNIITNRQKLIKQKLCPICGGSLILKNKNSKNFFVCSNFPRCHFFKLFNFNSF